jgi:hypothetical protein
LFLVAVCFSCCPWCICVLATALFCSLYVACTLSLKTCLMFCRGVLIYFFCWSKKKL